MGMTTNRAAEAEPMLEMNMTPLIDVMLVLIIMFIITIPIQNHSFTLNMPAGPTAPDLPEPKVADLTIDFDGTLYWNNAVVDRNTLDGKLAAVAAEKDQTELHVRANKLAKYRDVASVLASAQRLGVEKIGMIGNEQFL